MKVLSQKLDLVRTSLHPECDPPSKASLVPEQPLFLPKLNKPRGLSDFGGSLSCPAQRKDPGLRDSLFRVPHCFTVYVNRN